MTAQIIQLSSRRANLIRNALASFAPSPANPFAKTQAAQVSHSTLPGRPPACQETLNRIVGWLS